MTTISILAVVFALAATVLAFIFIVPDHKRKKLNKLGKLVHDIVNFRFLIIEKILQALYIFCTALVVMFGFFMLFYFQKGYSGFYYSTPTRWYGGWGLLIMILGPIAIRLVYEGMMLVILLVKNVIQINNKLEAPSDAKGEGKEDIFGVNLPFSAPAEEPKAQPEPEYNFPTAAAFCPYCGAKAGDGPFCSVCGTRL